MTDLTKAIQRHVGVPTDGKWGPVTAAAVAKALGIEPVIEPVQELHALANPAAFFGAVRKITGALNQVQVDTINDLLTAAARWPLGWLAYGLATAWHEARLEPIEEIGRGKGRPYGKPDARMKPMADALTYGGQIPYGRGLVQLTWCDNYEWADKALGLNGALLADFDLALNPDVAVRILVKGMEDGAFTGKPLSDYLPGWRGTVDQFTAARRVVNGTDRADLIAGYAVKFQHALEVGGWA